MNRQLLVVGFLLFSLASCSFRKQQSNEPSAAEKESARKTLSYKNYEELKQSKNERMAANDKPGALRYLEKMVPLCNDLAELKLLMLELADLLFAMEDYTRSADMYREFTLLYPGSDEVEYALYRAILSNFKLTLDAEHDQSKTLTTKELALAFLERSELFTVYAKEVEDILMQCEQRLLANDISIFNFYVKRQDISSAQNRLSLIKKDYLTKQIPDVQLQIAQLEKMVPVELPHEVHEIMQDRTTVVAEAEQPTQEKEKSFIDRF
jgi:outer membrane assembly lipoprotein YfiO